MTQKVRFNDMEVQLPDFQIKKIGPIALLVIGAILVLTSFYTVEANENAVVLRLGKYSHTTMPGLHFKIPLIDTIHSVKVDYQYKMEFGFRTIKSGVRTQYSGKSYKNESWMLTGDLKIAEVHWVVQYKVKDAFAYLFNVKNVENTIKDVSESTMRLMVGDRSFSEALQAERRNIGEGARKLMQAKLDEYNTGISIEMVQLQSVVPPEPVADSFNEVNRAKQDQETMINNARQEYNKQNYC